MTIDASLVRADGCLIRSSCVDDERTITRCESPER
jgi:hypothetical protein